MRVQTTSLQKSYKLNVGVQNFTVEFKGANKQLYWLEMQLAYCRSDKHNTFYDSYNVELATTYIKKITLENTGNTYNMANTLNMI